MNIYPDGFISTRIDARSRVHTREPRYRGFIFMNSCCNEDEVNVVE